MKGNKLVFILFIISSVFISGCIFYPGGDDVHSPYDIDPPTAEVMGEELPDVPKYEPSTRTEYYKNMFGEVSGYEMTVGITYYTVDHNEKVSQFYLNEMPKFDWKLKHQDSRISDNNNYFRIFTKDFEYIKSDCYDEFCSPRLDIDIVSPEGKGYSLIYIFYMYCPDGNIC